MKAIKALMNKNIVYAVYHSEENTLMAVIVCQPEDDGKVVDITPRVEQIVREYFVAESATLHSLPKGILIPESGVQSFGSSLVENEEETERTFEICVVTCY